MPDKPRFDYTLTPTMVYITRDPRNPSIARLEIGVSNLTEADIECDWVAFIIKVGAGAGDLTADPTSIAASSSDPDNWGFNPIAGAAGQFRAEPKSPNRGLKPGGGVVFQLDNIIVNGLRGPS